MKILYQDRTFMKRDLATITNIPGRTKRDFEHYANQLLKDVSWSVQSHEFIISPSFDKNNPEADNLDPHNQHDINKLINYDQLFLHECFDGHFKTTDSYVKNGHKRYRYKYVFPSKDDESRFPFILDIQPDSSKNARLHSHAVLLNKDLVTGRAMRSNYYGYQHIRKAIHKTTTLWNTQHPHDRVSDIAKHNKQGRMPDTDVKHIINALNQARKTNLVKSQKALISYLKPYHVDAKRTKRTKRKRAGWKFRYHQHKFIKASVLSTYRGAKNFSSKGIKEMLAKNRKNYGQAVKQKKLATNTLEENSTAAMQPIMSSKTSVSSSVSSSASTSSTAAIMTTPLQAFRAERTLITSSYDSYTQSVSASVLYQAKEHQPTQDLQQAYNQVLDYEHNNSTTTINNLMPKLSSDTVRKATPQVIKTYQTQSVDKPSGLKEFYVISNDLHFTDYDKNNFSNTFGSISHAIRITANKFKKSKLYRKLNDLYTSSINFCRKHFNMNMTDFSIHHVIKELRPKYKKLLSNWHPLRNSHIKQYNNSLKASYVRSIHAAKAIDSLINSHITSYANITEPVLSSANDSALRVKSAMSSAESLSIKASKKTSSEATNKILQKTARDNILFNRAQTQYYLRSESDLRSVLANTDIGKAVTSAKPSNYENLSDSLIKRDMSFAIKYPSPNGFPVMTPERYQMKLAYSYLAPKARKYSASASYASHNQAKSKARATSISEDYTFSREITSRRTRYAQKRKTQEKKYGHNKSRPSHDDYLHL